MTPPKTSKNKHEKNDPRIRDLNPLPREQEPSTQARSQTLAVEEIAVNAWISEWFKEADRVRRDVK